MVLQGDNGLSRRNAIEEIFPLFGPRFLFTLSNPEIMETWLEMKTDSDGLLLEVENHGTTQSSTIHFCFHSISSGIPIHP